MFNLNRNADKRNGCEINGGGSYYGGCNNKFGAYEAPTYAERKEIERKLADERLAKMWGLD